MSLAAALLLAAAGGPAVLAPDAPNGVQTRAGARAAVEITRTERISFAAMDAAAKRSAQPATHYQRTGNGLRVTFEFD
jgi:hypothetical protein